MGAERSGGGSSGANAEYRHFPYVAPLAFSIEWEKGKKSKEDFIEPLP